jgi:hypothetical protein
MPYQVIDGVMARAIQSEAASSQPLFTWIVMRDPPDHPGAFVAHLMTDAPTRYVLLGHTLAEVQVQLPPGLVCSQRLRQIPLRWWSSGFRSSGASEREVNPARFSPTIRRSRTRNRLRPAFAALGWSGGEGGIFRRRSISRY